MLTQQETIKYFICDRESEQQFIKGIVENKLVKELIQCLCFKKDSWADLKKKVELQKAWIIKTRKSIKEKQISSNIFLSENTVIAYLKLKSEQFTFNCQLFESTQNYTACVMQYRNLNQLIDAGRFVVASPLIQKQFDSILITQTSEYFLETLLLIRTRLKLFIEERIFNVYLDQILLASLIHMDHKIWGGNITLIQNTAELNVKQYPFTVLLNKLDNYLYALQKDLSLIFPRQQFIIYPEPGDFSVIVLDVTWDSVNKLFKVLVLNLGLDLETINEILQLYFKNKKWNYQFLVFQSFFDLNCKLFNTVAYIFCCEVRNFGFEFYDKKAWMSEEVEGIKYLSKQALPAKLIVFADTSFKKTEESNNNLMDVKSSLKQETEHDRLYRIATSFKNREIGQQFQIEQLFRDLKYKLSFLENYSLSVLTDVWLIHYEDDFNQPLIIISKLIKTLQENHTFLLNMCIVALYKNSDSAPIVSDICSYFLNSIKNLHPNVLIKLFSIELNFDEKYVLEKNFDWRLSLANEYNELLNREYEAVFKDGKSSVENYHGFFTKNANFRLKEELNNALSVLSNFLPNPN